MKKILLFLSFLLMSVGMFGTVITIEPSNFKNSYGDNTFKIDTTEFAYSGVQYTAKNTPSGFAVKQFIQLRKSGSGAGEIKNNDELTLKRITIVTQNDKPFTLSAGAVSDNLSDLSKPSGTNGKYTCKAIDNTDTEVDIITYTFDVTGKKYFKFINGGNAQYLAYITIELDDVTPPSYTITAQPNDDSYGTVLLFGNVITATPATGYRVSTTTPYEITSGTATVAQSGNVFIVTTSVDCTIKINFEVATTPPSPEPVVNILAFELLTDVNDLQYGDSIIIVDKDNTYAMGEDRGNNRQGSNTFDYIDNIIELQSEHTIQIIQIDTIEGSTNWRLLVGNDAYLYAADNNNNHLKTANKSTAGDNGKWKITITDSIATIIAQGDKTHNQMRYNYNNGNPPLFSCYANGQTPLKIYKKLSCTKYSTVIFKNNGINYDTIYVPSCVKRLSTIPTNPSRKPNCNETAIFVGWSEHEVSLSNTKPVGLFQTIKDAPIIDEDKIFNAVYANENIEDERPGSFLLTISTRDFNGTSYAANEGYQTNTAISTDIRFPNDTVHVKWYSHNVMRSGSMQWRSSSGSGGAGYIYNSTDLSNITEILLYDEIGSFTKYYGTSECPTSSTDIGTNKGYFCVKNGNSTGSTSKITIKFTKNIIPKTYSNYTTYCIDTLETEGDWNNSDNWKHSRVPEFNEAAVLLKPVTVNIPHATAKYVIIDKSSTNTGKLTIGANQGLEVQDTISVYDGTYKATTPSDLVLESSEAGNASLIFNNKNNNQATVCLYSKSKIVGNTWHWQYMGTAMTSLNALYNYYGSWVYEWVKNTGWVAVTNGATMSAWKGYCITQENERGEWYATTGTLVKTDELDTTLTVPVGKDMVFANSWTAPIHISKLVESGFVMNPMNVYLFNTGSAPKGSKQGTDAGTHIVIPVHAAPYLKDTLIAPQQGFFVSNINGTIEGSIHLDYKKLVRGSDSIVAGPMRAPKRNAEVLDKPDVMKIYTNGISYGDNVVILEREGFSTGFDNGWDGNKSSFGVNAPSIYVINTDGTYDAVSSIPNYEGTMLGFRSGIDSVYTITFEYDGENEWYLNDLTTLTSTLIGSDSKYTFTHDSENDVRFIISATPYADIATDIDNINNANKIHKYLHNGNLYIMKNNRIFNAIGNLIQ